MNILSTVGLAVALAITVTSASASGDDELLQGTWKTVEATLGGQPLPPAALQGITLKISGNAYEVTVAGEPETDRGTMQLHSGSNPKTMTIIGLDGPNRGKTFPSIYEIKGDMLRVCYDLSGTKFPIEFKSVKGTQLYLATYERKTGTDSSQKQPAPSRR
jgi:uncharacterized protein (TIGR03067 family)